MATTEKLDAAHPAALARAAELLRSGGIVAFPTETVYGLGANALSAPAVERIFAAKQRPAWDPLIVHVADAAHITTVATVPTALSSRVAALAAAFWPGPLTLLLPRIAAVPDAVTASRELVGVRVPHHPVARALLHEAALPVAAPSANTFGHTSPTTAQHVLDDLDGRIDAVLDGGPCSLGVESTVLEPATMTLYRPGGVTAAQLEAVTGVRVLIYEAPPRAPAESLPSPGVGIRHYAPRARLLLVKDPAELTRTAHLITVEGKTAGVLLPDGWQPPPHARIFPWGNFADTAQLASRLYAGLRALDAQHVDVILAPLPPAGPYTAALLDRLEKAARP